MKKWPGVLIQIGPDAEIDEDVILGYPSPRFPAGGGVMIGAHARIRSGSVIYQGVTIGDRFEAGHHVIIREQNQLGDSVSVWSNTVIDYSCRIGSRVKIHANGYVAQFTVIEDDVFVAPGAVFANDKYPPSDRLEGPRLKKGARIGVNATLLPGVVIGAGALVGAGSVVTRNVADHQVVAGNPARPVGTKEKSCERSLKK